MFKQIWFPEMIQQHIMSRLDKEPLNSYYYATNYPDVYAAAERVFGSWGGAIEACGLDYSLIKKYKTGLSSQCWTKSGGCRKKANRCSPSMHRIITSLYTWRRSNVSATGVKPWLPGWIIRVSVCAAA